MAAPNDPNSLPSLAIRICPATLSLLGFRLLHTLLRLSRPSTSTTASPPSPAWLLVLAPMSGSNRRAPNHTFNQRSLILLDSTLSERSGRPRSVPPWLPRESSVRVWTQSTWGMLGSLPLQLSYGWELSLAPSLPKRASSSRLTLRLSYLLTVSIMMTFTSKPVRQRSSAPPVPRCTSLSLPPSIPTAGVLEPNSTVLGLLFVPNDPIHRGNGRSSSPTLAIPANSTLSQPDTSSSIVMTMSSTGATTSTIPAGTSCCSPTPR